MVGEGLRHPDGRGLLLISLRVFLLVAGMGYYIAVGAYRGGQGGGGTWLRPAAELRPPGPLCSPGRPREPRHGQVPHPAQGQHRGIHGATGGAMVPLRGSRHAGGILVLAHRGRPGPPGPGPGRLPVSPRLPMVSPPAPGLPRSVRVRLVGPPTRRPSSSSPRGPHAWPLAAGCSGTGGRTGAPPHGGAYQAWSRGPSYPALGSSSWASGPSSCCTPRCSTIGCTGTTWPGLTRPSSWRQPCTPS